MKFSVVYKDLTVIRGTTVEEWYEAPQDGVLYVITLGGICKPSDYYLPISGELHGSTSPNSLLHYYPEIKFGITVDKDTFEEAGKVAKTEMKRLNNCSGC